MNERGAPFPESSATLLVRDREEEAEEGGEVTHFLSLTPEVGDVSSAAAAAAAWPPGCLPPPPMAVSRWLLHPDEARPSRASSRASSKA